jgi:hypothetical protein
MTVIVQTRTAGLPRVLASGVGTQTLTNSVSTDQDFTSIYTFAANEIQADSVFRVSFMVENVMGTSTVTWGFYLKIGATKMYTVSAVNPANGQTNSLVFSQLIFGRAAPSASSAVSAAPIDSSTVDGGRNNFTDQPVNLATNGTLTINWGVVWSATGSTETMELQGWVLEKLK